MNEQRVREIVREELAELRKEVQPTIVITTDVKLADADSVIDRFAKRLTTAHKPKQPWD